MQDFVLENSLANARKQGAADAECTEAEDATMFQESVQNAECRVQNAECKVQRLYRIAADLR